MDRIILEVLEDTNRTMLVSANDEESLIMKRCYTWRTGGVHLRNVEFDSSVAYLTLHFHASFAG